MKTDKPFQAAHADSAPLRQPLLQHAHVRRNYALGFRNQIKPLRLVNPNFNQAYQAAFQINRRQFDIRVFRQPALLAAQLQRVSNLLLEQAVIAARQLGNRFIAGSLLAF